MSVNQQQTGEWAPDWAPETEPEYTPRPRRSRKQRRPKWPGVVLALVCLATIAALVWHFTRQQAKPLETAAGYIASASETAPLYDEEGAVLEQLIRGSQVNYVVEEADENHPDQVRVPREDGSFGWLDRANLTSDVNAVVTLETVYVRRAQNLTDGDGNPTGPLVLRGQALTVTGYRGLAEDGSLPSITSAAAKSFLRLCRPRRRPPRPMTRIWPGSTPTGATAGAAATRRGWTMMPMKSPSSRTTSCPAP